MAPDAETRSLRRDLLPLVSAVFLLAGCVVQRTGLAPPYQDGGLHGDARVADAGRGDATLPDGSVVPPDSGPPDGGRDAPPVVDAGNDAGCGADRGLTCSGATLRQCSSGAEVDIPCDLGCSTTGGAHCRVMVPSNVAPDLLTAATGALHVTTSYDIDTDDCTASLPGITFQVVPQSGHPGICAVSVRSLTVDSGQVLSASGSRPLAILASGDVTILGTIDVSGVGTMPGPGALSSDGGGDGTHAATYDDGGGGGGGMCGAGGRGGTGGSAAGGAGGAARSPDMLVPLVGGTPGGHGSDSTVGGPGGGGGGALQISALGTIDVEGTIAAGGGGGSGGADVGAGGGGGSGGAILLEAPSIVLGGGGDLDAAGGGGGAGACSSGDGGSGDDGNVAFDSPANGGSPSTACSSTSDGAGGPSGGGDTPDGLPGDDVGYNAGGGGGGAGCIVLRTASGSLPSSATGLNPSRASGAVQVLRLQRQ